MNKKSFVKRILAVALSVIMVLGLMPVSVLASDTFPGKPDGMTVTGSAIETINGQTVWLCPNSGGNIVKTTSGNGYAIYEAAPYAGYTFSHWATYCVAADWWDTFESANRYDEEEGYAFSKSDSKTARYNEKDSQIRVNTSNEANYTYYVYAVFVEGYKVNVSVDGNGEIVAARNLSNYLGSQYETYVEYVKNTEFIAPSGIKLQIDFNAEGGHHFDKVLINNQDKTADYISGNTTSFRMIIDSVQSALDIKVTTKPNEYTLTFHGNGGTTAGGADSYTQTYTHGSNPTIAENQFAKSGYTLSRWNTAADGSGTNYGDKQIMTKNQSLDLYAVWTEQHDHSDSDGDGICDICGVIPYVHRQWNETTMKMESIEQLTPVIPTKITSTTTKISNSWYVVQGNVPIDGTLEVDGEAHLVLANGAKLTVGGGINVNDGNTLHIYSQSDGTGTLVATGSEGDAGIGGKYFSACGTIVIHGGNITASGSGQAAGIGGGSYRNGGTVTIFGGSVTASGSENAAGIGGGNQGNGGIVNIYGGTVVSLGGEGGGAGIGGGLWSDGGTVRICGGNVKANGGGKGENIGTGAYGKNSGTLTDGNNTPVSLTTITLDGAANGTPVTAVEGITGYGLTDVKTLDTDKLYFYLPANSTPTGVTAGGQEYKGSVENGQGTFTEHQHNWTYSNFDNTITAQCTADGCTNNGGSATIVQDAEVPTAYTGFAIEALKVIYDKWQGGNLDIVYSNNVNAGTASGTISIGGASASQTFEITKATMTNISAQGYSVIYDGQAHGITVNAPAGATVSYKTGDGAYSSENPTFKDAGTYTVTYKVSMANYADVEDAAEVKIDKAPLTVAANDHSIKYGEAPANNGVTYSDFVSNETEAVLNGTLDFDYTYAKGNNIGTYEITPKGLTSNNYEITFAKGTLKVERADATCTAPTANDLTYTGAMQELATAGTVDGGKMVFSLDKEGGYSETLSAKNAGKYTVWYKVIGDDNHNSTAPASITVEIKKATPDLGTVSADGTVDDTTKPEDVVLTQTGTVKGTFVITDMAMLANKPVYNYTFTPNDTDNYNSVNGQVTIDVQDTVLPTISISLDDHKWTFWDTITFGLFYNESKEVNISYADNENGSGLKDTLYFVANREMTVEELQNVQWVAYTKAFDIDPDSKCVVYAKAVDNDGNTLIINSNGLVLDKTQAVVEGITNGGTYYGQLVFAVADELAGVKSVLIDGLDKTSIEGQYVIDGDNAEHTVVVTDNAGNVTEYKVTVYKNYTVTYVADGETVAEITVGHGENAAFPKVPPKDGYVGKWDRNNENITSDTVINAVYTKISVVKPDEVKPEDKANLEDTKKQFEDMLNDDDYTEDDKKAIQDAIDDIEDALAKLNKPVTDPDSPQTGDNSHMALWIALLFISGGAVITLTVVDKKRRTANR